MNPDNLFPLPCCHSGKSLSGSKSVEAGKSMNPLNLSILTVCTPPAFTLQPVIAE